MEATTPCAIAVSANFSSGIPGCLAFNWLYTSPVSNRKLLPVEKLNPAYIPGTPPIAPPTTGAASEAAI